MIDRARQVIEAAIGRVITDAELRSILDAYWALEPGVTQEFLTTPVPALSGQTILEHFQVDTFAELATADQAKTKAALFLFRLRQQIKSVIREGTKRGFVVTSAHEGATTQELQDIALSDALQKMNLMDSDAFVSG